MFLSPAVKISICLALIAMTVYFVADELGLTVDHQQIREMVWAKNSESLAVQLSASLTNTNKTVAVALIKSIAHLNKDLQAIAIEHNGKIIDKYGNIDTKKISALKNSSGYYRVPLFKNNETWGYIHFVYALENSSILSSFMDNNKLVLPIFIFFSSLIFFSILLKSIVKNLDPSSVIPERVGRAFDTLAEGIIVLDTDQNILLVNLSFTKMIGVEKKEVIGKHINKLPWQYKSNEIIIAPWEHAERDKTTVIGKVMNVMTHLKEAKIFSINCSHIVDNNDNVNGLLITIDDITEKENKNKELFLTVKMLNETKKKLKQKNKELKEIADKDPLTNCLNRRAFYKIYTALIEDVHNTGKDLSLSCMMFDIDHFKKINDNYGHPAGDEAIKTIAGILEENIKTQDSVCRYGGEEFCIIMKVPVQEGFRMAETIRKKIESHVFGEASLLKGHKITCSIGISELTSQIKKLETLIDYADKALYYAKENGRNQVICWQNTALQNVSENSVHNKDTL
ncbi:sensor domain-containing diguanylate cyclase [Candidatus Berkiella cookevillensis]|uniref:diguanylate cyclase n=1 Tax=Candidatus Berkiella cookevillensis TaxID=437022 RepID=A0A0Q9YJT6_9GAMM|nr:sensor domain-containing diguanylate cyclase [Candidatus Berkiella cookevillensis]MCS5709074.1 sensor domain-containing diguanylate cyclase [Candidatus Berkiella cookevillensis]